MSMNRLADRRKEMRCVIKAALNDITEMESARARRKNRDERE